jgi:hypothetical protein
MANDSTIELYRPIPHVEIRAFKHAETRESAVRLYCTQSYEGGRWNLQVRASETLANGAEGQRFLIGTATLDRESMIALRDAIDAQLEAVAE